jgi:P-type Cu+ transporter
LNEPEVGDDSEDNSVRRKHWAGIDRFYSVDFRILTAGRNIRQNLFFAFIYNIIGVPIAAGVLFPAFHVLLNPMIAAAAMSFSSVSVITKALRLRSVRL